MTATSTMVRPMRELIGRLRDIVGDEWCLHGRAPAAHLRVRRAAAVRRDARRRGPAGHRGAGPGVRPRVRRGGASRGSRAARARGCRAARCRSTDGVLIVTSRMKRDARDRPAEPARLRRAGRDEHRGLDRGRARLLLPARPELADRLLDRRQRRRELGRRALLQVRLHDELRLRAGGRARPTASWSTLGGRGARPARLRPARRVRRLRGHARDRHEGLAARDAGAGDRQDARRLLRLDARGRRGGLGDRPVRRRARRDRDDGQGRDRGERADGARRLPGRPRRRAARRARRRRARVRGALRGGRRDLRALRLRRRARRARRGRAPAVLEDAQGRVPGDGPHLAQLLRAGRRDPAHEAARGARARSTRSPRSTG